MLDTRQDLTLRSSVAPQLVRYDHARHILQTYQQLSEEPLGRFATAPALHEDIEHIPILIHRAPEIVQLAANADEHLVHEPLVARLGSAPLQSFGEQPPETDAPVADGFVADHDTVSSQDHLDVAQAQAEAVIEPDSMLDDRGWKAEAKVGIGRARHGQEAAMPAQDLPT